MGQFCSKKYKQIPESQTVEKPKFGVTISHHGRWSETKFHDEFDEKTAFGEAICDFYKNIDGFSKALHDYIKQIDNERNMDGSVVVLGVWYNLKSKKFELKHGKKEEYRDYTYSEVYDNNTILVVTFVHQCLPNLKFTAFPPFVKWKEINLSFKYRINKFKDDNKIKSFNLKEINRLKRQMRLKQIENHQKELYQNKKTMK